MNKAYKVVYSKARQKFVVASELVRACADRPHSSRFVSVSALMAALLTVFSHQASCASTAGLYDDQVVFNFDSSDGIANKNNASGWLVSSTTTNDAIAIGQGSIAKNGEISFGAVSASSYIGRVLTGENPGSSTGSAKYWNFKKQADGTYAIGPDSFTYQIYEKDENGTLHLVTKKYSGAVHYSKEEMESLLGIKDSKELSKNKLPL